LLDIEMKDGNGFEVFKHFLSPSFKTIFVTAYQQYSFEAFRFSAIDYLLKPVDPDQLINAVNKAQDHIDKENLSVKIETFLHNMEHAAKGKKIILKTLESIHIVNISDIVYCEANEGYTMFYLSDRTKILVSRTLREFDEMLADHSFARIHQTFLVNINCIKRYEKGDGGQVVLSNDNCLPVSVRKKEQLMKLLAKL
jgi:two-component system LytT family response regulator